jgi:hypothetical protein
MIDLCDQREEPSLRVRYLNVRGVDLMDELLLG